VIVRIGIRQSKHPVAGPILDILFGQGVMPRSEIPIRSARLKKRTNQTAIVAIDMVVRDRPQTTTYYLIADGVTWLIDNVDYGDTDYVTWMTDLIRRSR
jgi:hypothetical protein